MPFGIVKKERIRYIDFFKALTIILVILGHVNFANTGIKSWIYAFHMPAFYFISGFSLNTEKKVTKQEYISLIQKNIYRLVLPYILWGLVFSKFSTLNCAKLAYGSYTMISSAKSLTSLWFLPVLFLALMMLYSSMWVLKKHFANVAKLCLMALGFIVGFLLPNTKIGYPWSINVAFVAFGFILLGNLARSIMAKVIPLFSDEKKIQSLLLKIVAMGLCLAGTLVYQYNIPDFGYVLMGKSIYGNPLMFLLTSFCGCGFLLFSSMILDQLLKGKPGNWLSWLGQNTLVVFAVQKPIIRLFKAVFSHIHIQDVFVLILTTIGTVLISSFACILINHLVPVFAGKQPIIAHQTGEKAE